MSKIKTLIAHNDIKITNDIIDSIKGLDYVEIIGTAVNGKETYNQIVNLKPDIVFTKYNMGEMNSIEIMKLSKEKLDNNIPIFNIIGDEIPDNELKQAIDIVGKKLNALIKEPYEDRITDILNDYKNIL